MLPFWKQLRPATPAVCSAPPDTYQVVLLALGGVLGVPLLLPASLLEVVVAAAVAVIVAGKVAPAPSSPSRSELLQQQERGKNRTAAVAEPSHP